MMARVKLTRAEAFYIREHYGRMPLAQIANDLDLPLAAVEEAVRDLRLEPSFKQLWNLNRRLLAGYADLPIG
jgi:hypothetical protein